MLRSPLLLGASSERERATQIGAARIGVGSTLLAAGLARRVFGVPAEHDTGALRLTARLAGIRNVVLGCWTLQVRDQGKEQRRLCYQLNAAVDAADIAVLAWAFLRHSELRQAALMGTALGGSALLGWLELLSDLD
ncbi:MAG: hypothetical protein JOZ46_01170 [Candidatus Dormibacteraeota bacterium]|nr:hypothetical protein [Candidatus Dormibacteraeota bacterium]MBV9524404.1 hypothetical protein [Candidatus Dormibacteraeota bacterium]